MGSQEERDWVDVANDLLSKCHISLRLTKVTDCDAGVFVALYQAILGEKVPDYIAATRSQEDDIHNVQSVIDSLALDYLQISLSHITGENVVRGDKESIKNLLEIFDGLLEYLTEHVSEEELLDEGEPNHMASKVGTSTDQQLEQLERLSQTSSVPSTIYSSKCSDGSESTAELIRLGDSARTFMASQEERINGIHHADISSSRVEVEALQDTEQSELDSAELVGLPVGLVSTGTPFPNSSLLKEPLHSAIPLQPPYQTTPRRLDRLAHSGTRSPASMPSQRGAEEEDKEHHAVPAKCQSPRSQPDSLPANVISSPRLSPDQSEVSVSSQRRGSAEVGGAQPEASRLGPRRVLFRTQPAVVPITVADTAGMRDSEESKVGGKPRPSSRRHHPGRTAVSKRPTEAQEELDEPLSQRTRRNRETEQELHQMSEKLARRLEELDSMLKRALGESLETSGTREEDKQSHHSDSVMERRGLQRHSDTAPTPKSSRTRSLSPSPPPVYHFLEAPLEGALAKDLQQYGSEVRQSERQSPQMLGKVVDKAYEEELKQFEERKRADVEKARGQAQDAERAYREAILQEVPCPPEPSRVNNPKVTLQHRTARARGRALPRKAAPMKVKDNDLLPILLEELPYLQLSPHTLTRMWKQQMKQSHRLAPQPDQRSRIKQANQIEEAQRRHDLLLEIIRKEQEHNQRLHDFKERIQQQKSAQNKLREQRQQVARARKYHNEYHVQLRARLMRTRTQEERMFKHIFEEGLELQKARLREQRAYAKEQRQEHQRRHRDQLESMENYYKDQFSLLAETLAQERHEIQVRKKAQEKALQKMRRELRAKMEREIGELQKIIIQNDDDTFFRDLEVERLRERLQMTSFQYRTGHRT